MTTIVNSSSLVVNTLFSFYKAGSNLLYRAGQSSLQGVEAAYYSRVRATPERAGDLTRFINRLATNHFSNWQAGLLCLNGFVTLNSARNFIDLTQNSMVKFASQTFMGSYLPAIPFACAMIYSTHLLVSKIMNPKGKSKTQVHSTTFQIVNIINSLALAFFTKDRIPLLLGACFSVYSLYKNHSVSWLKMKGSKDLSHPRDIQTLALHLLSPLTKIKVLYSAMLLKKVNKADDCSICLEARPDNVFCTNGHAFHRECLKGHIQGRAEFFYDKHQYTRVETKHYENFIYKNTTWSYNIDIPESSLPACPNCNERPPQHNLDITVWDREKGSLGAEINVIREHPQPVQRTFEKIHAIYNIFQAGLAALQRVPEFAPAITTLRHYLIVSDILSAVMTNYYLTKNIGPDKKHWLITTIPLAMIAIPAFFYLDTTFSYVGNLSKLAPRGSFAQFETPYYVGIHQLLNTYRLFATVGLSYFSTAHKAFNFASIITQSFGLLGSITIPWLRVEQSGFPVSFENLSYPKVHSYAVISSSTAKNDHFLKRAIASLASLQRNFFTKGTASLQTTTQYSPLYSVSRSIKLFYKLKKIFNLTEFITKPFYWSSEGSILHNLHGRLPINIASESQFPSFFD
ncbi:MAG: hypothetical protein K1000chlam3_01682 [Chlamydiae bacterium]|nr:hypothetical protein [Chlamydiota bacterium]